MYIHKRTKRQRRFKGILIAIQGLFCGLLMVWSASRAAGGQGNGAFTLDTATLVVFTIALGGAVAVQYWKLDRHPRYFLTRNTLAIKKPGKSIRFIHPNECAYYKPHSKELVLKDGSSVSFASPDFLRRRGDGLEAHLFATWFPRAYGDDQLRDWISDHPVYWRVFVVGFFSWVICQVSFLVGSFYAAKNPPPPIAVSNIVLGIIIFSGFVLIACCAISLVPLAFRRMRRVRRIPPIVDLHRRFDVWHNTTRTERGILANAPQNRPR